MDVTFFPTAAAFRSWLEQHHATAEELWVGYHKVDSGLPSLSWPESVDQALCFGWIDGLRRSIDEQSYRIRFTARRPTSRWSQVNLARVAELTALGLMRPAGLAAFEARRAAGDYSYEQRHQVELDPALERSFRASSAAWAFFESQPPGYRRTALYWVMSAKRGETRQRRLATLIADSAEGRRLGMLARPEPRE